MGITPSYSSCEHLPGGSGNIRDPSGGLSMGQSCRPAPSREPRLRAPPSPGPCGAALRLGELTLPVRPEASILPSAHQGSLPGDLFPSRGLFWGERPGLCLPGLRDAWLPGRNRSSEQRPHWSHGVYLQCFPGPWEPGQSPGWSRAHNLTGSWRPSHALGVGIRVQAVSQVALKARPRGLCANQ